MGYILCLSNTLYALYLGAYEYYYYLHTYIVQLWIFSVHIVPRLLYYTNMTKLYGFELQFWDFTIQFYRHGLLRQTFCRYVFFLQIYISLLFISDRGLCRILIRCSGKLLYFLVFSYLRQSFEIYLIMIWVPHEVDIGAASLAIKYPCVSFVWPN